MSRRARYERLRDVTRPDFISVKGHPHLVSAMSPLEVSVLPFKTQPPIGNPRGK